MSILYLAIILFSICGLLCADWRYRLAFFESTKRTALVISISVLFFLVWDAAGIASGIFFAGESAYTTGVMLAPEMPLEEPFFLILLAYNALLLWQIGGRLWPHTRS